LKILQIEPGEEFLVFLNRRMDEKPASRIFRVKVEENCSLLQTRNPETGLLSKVSIWKPSFSIQELKGEDL